MELEKAFDDERVRLLLIGNERELAEAVTHVNNHLQKRFAKGVRERLPGLRSQDLADAWQESLLALIKASRDKTFDPDREFGPWFWTIFFRRAIDKVRRRDTYADMLDRAKQRLEGTSLGDFVARMDEEERAQLLDRIRKAVETLPSRQKIVIQVFMDQFPATEDMKVLRERVSAVTGREESLAAVKRALQEARRAIGEIFKTQQR